MRVGNSYNMTVYEMIFQKNPFEQTNAFYSENTKKTREHFINSIKSDIDNELKEFHQECKSNHKNNLLELLEIVNQETIFHINFLKENFIENSNSEFDDFVKMVVKEHITVGKS